MTIRLKNAIPLSRWFLILLIPILLSGCNSAPKVDWDLTINGEVGNPITFTFAEMAGMEMVDLDDVLMEKSRGEDEVRSFSGVPLEVLFDLAGVPETYSSITVTAADGYAIEISRDEMVDGIVALKQGGDWIVNVDEKAGPIRLVFPTTPANRWVYKVTGISVNP